MVDDSDVSWFDFDRHPWWIQSSLKYLVVVVCIYVGVVNG